MYLHLLVHFFQPPYFSNSRDEPASPLGVRSLQTLRIISVGSFASGSRNASSCTSPSLSSTLSVSTHNVSYQPDIKEKLETYFATVPPEDGAVEDGAEAAVEVGDDGAELVVPLPVPGAVPLASNCLNALMSAGYHLLAIF